MGLQRMRYGCQAAHVHPVIEPRLLDFCLRNPRGGDKPVPAPKKPRPKKVSTEASPAVTNFILATMTVVIGAIGSVLWLQSDQWVAGQKLWLISRASAVAAYVVLTAVVLLGLLLSNPRNKDTLRWTPHLLPWHQALMAAMFALISLHLFFTLTDSKSGVSWPGVLFPVHSRYHPTAMVLGALGLYGLVVVTVSTALRKWTRSWLPLHRLSWLTWILVCFHGLLGGSDTVALRPLYLTTGGILFVTFFWRHWVGANRNRSTPASVSGNEVQVTGGVDG